MNLLFTILLDMAQASAAANRILSFRVKSSTASKTLSELQETEGGVKIELRDLWFKYPTRDIPIFTGLNLTVRISLQPRNELF
jgi:ATP-binding cassette subfamily B (MDR/TAP) protein 1